MAASVASRVLDGLLRAEGFRGTLEARFDRMTLWRWRTGRGKPSAGAVGELEELTGGAVRARDWSDLPEAGAVSPKRVRRA